MTDLDRLLRRSVSPSPLTLRPSAPSPRPWSAEARAALLGLVLGLAAVIAIGTVAMLVPP